MTGWNGFDLLMLLLGLASLVLAGGLAFRLADTRKPDGSGDVYGETVDALGFDPIGRR